MRFMTLWRPGKNANPQSEKLFAEMGHLIADMTKAGVMVETGGWDPGSACTALKMAGGHISVTDGPFAEAKELVAGFAILDVKSKEEAIDWCKRFLKIAGEGTSEMRELPQEPQT
jgi:hypothetical protein